MATTATLAGGAIGPRRSNSQPRPRLRSNEPPRLDNANRPPTSPATSPTASALVRRPTAAVPALGKVPALTPRNSAFAWVMKDLGQGLRLGGGVNHVGERFTSLTNLVTLPAYTTVDAALQYTLGQWDLDVNVKNLANRKYYVSSHGTERKNRVFVKDLGKKDAKVVGLLEQFDASYDFIANEGPLFYFRTDKNAPKSRIIAIDIRKPAPDQWKELVPEAAETLTSANIINKQLVLNYLTDAHSAVKIFDLKGKPVRTLALPGIGSAAGFNGKAKDSETFYAYTSFTTPATIYRYDMKTGKSSVCQRRNSPGTGDVLHADATLLQRFGKMAHGAEDQGDFLRVMGHM
eukprot:gene43654-54233_t